MDTFGRHLLAEYHGCDRAILNDEEQIRSIMQAAARAARVTVVAEVFHGFAPQGVSGVVVVEESHLSIHTWPEAGYAAVDFYTCGNGLPDAATDVVRDGLKADQVETMIVHRGVDSGERSMLVRKHRRDAAGSDQPRVFGD